MVPCFIPKKSADEANRRITLHKNRRLEKSFARVPYAERVIFVPHCMRNVAVCKAKEMGSYYQCIECGGCKIGPLSKKARELGYRALYILKGGRTVEKLTAETKPKAVVGVACFFEGAQGMKLIEKEGLPVQFVALTKDGCADTDVDLDEVFRTLERYEK